MTDEIRLGVYRCSRDQCSASTVGFGEPLRCPSCRRKLTMWLVGTVPMEVDPRRGPFPSTPNPTPWSNAYGTVARKDAPRW